MCFSSLFIRRLSLLLLLIFLCIGRPLKATNSDSVLLWKSRGDSFYAESIFDTALFYYEKCNSIAVDQKNFADELQYSTDIMKSLLRMGKYQEAIDLGYKNIELSKKLEDFKALAITQNNIAIALFQIGKVPDAMIHFKESNNAYHTLGNDSLTAKSSTNLGIAYKIYYVYDKAIDYLHQAIRLYEKAGMEEGQGYAHNSLGNIYEVQKDSSRAMEQFLLALQLFKTNNDLTGIASTYNNIGYLYRNVNTDSAIHYFNLSLKIKNKLPNEKERITTLNSMAEVEINRANYNIADSLLQTSLLYARRNKHIKGIATAISHLGALSIHFNQFKQAEQLLQKGFQIAEKINDFELLQINLNSQIDLLQKTDRWEKIPYLFEQIIKYKNKEFDEYKTKVVYGKVISFDLERSKKKTELLEERTEKQQAEIEAKETRNLLLIVTLLFSSLILIFFIKQSIERKKHNKKLHQLNDQLEELLHEQHHRVKNFLQTIISIFRMHTRNAKDELVRDAVKEGRDRVNAMLLIHKKLGRPTPDSPANIDLKEYIIDLIEQIKSAYDNAENIIHAELWINHVNFDVNKSMAVGIIINEVINNSFKHALKENDNPRIDLCIEKINNEIRLEIRDNGKGIAPDLKEGRADSLGMKLIKNFAQNLGGKYTFENNKGTLFKIEFNA